MKIDFPLISTKPKAPKPKAQVSKPKVDDYYVKTQVSSMMVAFSGRGRGLEVTLSKTDLERFNTLKEIFGEGFGLNEVVEFAANFSRHAPNRIKTYDLALKESESAEDRLTKKFKPSEGALTEILKFGKDNAASKLVTIGINALYRMWCEEVSRE